MRMRLATHDDIPMIAKLARQWRMELGYVMIPALRESIERQSLIVADIGGQVVGFVNFRRRRDGWQTIYEIAVDRGHLRAGVGRWLVEMVPRPVRLKCTKDNAANEFYRQIGFKHIGTEVGRKRPLNVYQLEGVADAQKN
jgi:ribosomal protein S18 acetylase RimI-like enzyme